MLRLRELRENAGITQAELGAKFGLTDSTISLYESEKRGIPLDLLIRFAAYFGVSADYLLGLNVEGPSLSPSEKRLLDYYRSFNDDGKGQIMDFAYRMKRSGLYEQGTDYFLKGIEMEDY